MRPAELACLRSLAIPTLSAVQNRLAQHFQVRFCCFGSLSCTANLQRQPIQDTAFLSYLLTSNAILLKGKPCRLAICSHILSASYYYCLQEQLLLKQLSMRRWLIAPFQTDCKHTRERSSAVTSTMKVRVAALAAVCSNPEMGASSIVG